MNGGHPLGGSPVGSPVIFWRMDENNGSTQYNSGNGGSIGDGTNNGAAWLNSSSCKSGSCLNFDTGSDFLTGGDLAFVDGATSLSFSLWINPQTLAVSRSIVSKYATNQTSFFLATDTTNSDELIVCIAASTSDACGTNYFITTNANLSTSTWQHIILVYDGTQANADRIKLYKNGKLLTGNVTGTIPASMVSGTTSTLELGDADLNLGVALLAYYDEFKVYTGALTQDQVLIDYNQGSAVNYGVGAPTPEPAQGTDGAGTAPVGYWNFDENTGTTVKDRSGNGNNTTSFTSNTKWAIGKVSSGLSFDGNLDSAYFTESGTTALDISGSFSMSAWVNYGVSMTNQDNYSEIINKCTDGPCDNLNYWFFAKDIDATPDSPGCGYQTGASFRNVYATTFSDPIVGRWYHFECVFDDTANTLTLYIDGKQSAQAAAAGSPSSGDGVFEFGGDSSGGGGFDFNGKIDEVKIYNYARSQAQIAYDYNRGAPIGWWKLDECQGTTAYDASGNGNNGTITIGATDTNTAPGTCSSGTATDAWYGGVTGKFNSSLRLDDTDDFVNVGNISMYSFERTQPFSVSAWVKTSTETAYSLVAKQDSNSPYSGWNLQTGAVGFVFLQIVNTYGSNYIEVRNTNAVTYGDSQWHMVTATYDGSSNATGIAIYFDGKAYATTSVGGASISATSVNSIPVYIGSRNGAAQLLNGSIDDARIYNYKLSATQVQKIYNDGSSVFLGPQTGSP